MRFRSCGERDSTGRGRSAGKEEARIRGRDSCPRGECPHQQIRKLLINVYLQREKDASSKERLTHAKKEVANIEDKLQPLKAQYENEKHRGDQINEIRKKLDELKAKADDAERKYDLATASDIRYYAIPDLQTKLERLSAEEAASGDTSKDTVTPEEIAEIVARWTNIPVTRLMSTEKEKLVCNSVYVITISSVLT